MTTIKLKRSATPGNAPASLETGELAVNEADHKLFFRDAGGGVQESDLDHDARTDNPHGVTAAQAGAAPASHYHADYLPLAGGTMTGSLTLNGDPADALHAAPKQYVDANAGLTDPVQNLSRLGINTTADTTNRLAISSPATLFTNEGAGHQVKVNKAGVGDTASFLFQTNWSGRAEMGLAGDDDFHFKVSPDGSAWSEALLIDSNNGRITLLERVVVKSTSGATTGMQVEEEELTLSGAYVESSIVIPNRAIVLGVSTRTTEAITGASSHDCGIAGEPSKFGGSLGVAAGSTNSGVIGPTAFYADTPIRLTANGGNFTGGKVRIAIHTLTCGVPQS